MSVVGTPTTPFVITRDQVRMFLRDRADQNILLDDVQFSDSELSFAIEMAVESYNAVTPASALTPSNFPNKYVLLIGTVKFLLSSESFLQIRNQATWSDGDVQNLGLHDKAAAYAQLAQQLKAEWDELTRGLKTQQNLEGAYNRLSSGYRSTSRFHQ
jgi:hypothetical protein